MFVNQFSRILSLTLVLMLISGCGDPVTKNKLKIFSYNQKSCRSLDPADASSQGVIWLVNQLYSGLVQMNERMEIKPSLAKYWEVSEDGKKYKFHLRTNVRFHDSEVFQEGKGRLVKASDFVYSFNRIIAEETASNMDWVFKGKVVDKEPFVAIDDSTFVINLEKPFPPFLGMLSMQVCSVVPKEAVEKYGKDFSKKPVGTGPFQFRNWDEGNKMFLVKNKNYFEKYGQDTLPFLDAIKVTFIQDKHTEMMAFLKGDLDFLTSIDASIKDELLTADGALTPQYAERIRLDKLPYLNTEYLGFMIDENQEKDVDGNAMAGHPLFNTKVRQAIAHAIDKGEIVRYLRNNIGSPAKWGFIPPVMFKESDYNWRGHRYDIAKSHQLLKEAGYPNGEGIPEIKMYVENGAVDICTAIQNQMKKIGLNVNLVPTKKTFIKTERDKQTLPCFYGQWIMDYPDPETFLTCFYGKNPSSPNFTRFHSSEFDALYEKAFQTVDERERNALYLKMDSIAADQVPLIPIYYDEIVNFSHKYVKGLNVTPSKLLNLKYVDIERQ